MQLAPMKADDSMPFFGTDFFAATEGYTDTVTVGYMRALWHYWNHTHCQGLPDDDEYLRRVCRCEPHEWARTKGIIFDNQFFFCKNGTHWHQKKAKELHAHQADIYNRRVALAKNAREAAANAMPGNRPDLSPSVRISMERELERVEKRLGEVRRAGTQVAGGPMRYSPDQAVEMKRLRERREELKKSLGFIA